MGCLPQVLCSSPAVINVRKSGDPCYRLSEYDDVTGGGVLGTQQADVGIVRVGDSKLMLVYVQQTLKKQSWLVDAGGTARTGSLMQMQ